MKKKPVARKRKPFKRVESHLEEKLLERLKTLAAVKPVAVVSPASFPFSALDQLPTALPLTLSVKRNFKPFQHRGNEMEFDFCWPDVKIAIEVHGGIYMKGRGGGHTSPDGLKRDYYKVNLSQTEGWILLLFPPDYCTSPDKASHDDNANWSVAVRLLKAAFKIRGVKVA